MKERFYLNGPFDLYSKFPYRAIQPPGTTWARELSKRNVNQANVIPLVPVN